MVTIVLLIYDLTVGNGIERIVLDLLTIVVNSVVLYLGVVKKQYLTGVVLVSAFGIFALTYATFLTGGVSSPFMLYYHLMALTSGMLFRGTLLNILGLGTLMTMSIVFFIQYFYPELINSEINSPLEYIVNHFAVFFLMFYGTWQSKKFLENQKDKLGEQNRKIAAQNRALSEQQDKINNLNMELQNQLDESQIQLTNAIKEAASREAYMRSLVESQTTFLFRIDMSGKILFINKALASLIQGNDSAQISADSSGFFQEKLMEKDRFFLEEIVFEALDKPGIPVKASLPVKENLSPTEKGPRYIDWEFLAVKNQSNGKMEIQAVGYDITHRLQAEQLNKEKSTQLELLTQNLIRRNKELTDFGYMVSHNLRGPVANIVGLTGLLNEEESSNVEVVQRLKIVSESLDGIIKDLSHIVDLKNTSRKDYEWIEMNELSRQLVLQLDEEIRKYGGDISIHFPEGFQLLLIKPYVYSILYNLLANALKYHHPDRNPNVLLGGTETIDGFRLMVQDNGQGIDLEKYGDRLFNLYERFNEGKEGKGIGLHMVKVQVEAMGGHIEVESQIDLGTTFTILFPKTSSGSVQPDAG